MHVRRLVQVSKKEFDSMGLRAIQGPHALPGYGQSEDPV